jgi:hypothetical protein
MLDYSWQDVTLFLNSNFTTSLTGALAGALGGALAAQSIADRAKRRETLLEEVKSTNVALMLTFTICNAGLALKKQFTKPIHDAYVEKRASLQEFQRQRALGQVAPNAMFEFQADLRTVPMPVVPIDALKHQVYEKISASGRPLALVVALTGSVAALAEVIAKRNVLIERFQRQGQQVEPFPALYFGLPYGGGHLNTEFADTVEGLYRLADDVIFFGELLGKDLIAHGTKVIARHKPADRKRLSLHRVDFTDASKSGLMPEEANYADWLKGFPSAAQQSAPADSGALRRLFFCFARRR